MIESKNIELRNVVNIAKAMGYEEEPKIFTGSGYYFTWRNMNEEDVKAIKEKTGIECSLSEEGTLLVPIYTNFKSPKEEDLLKKLSQYGTTMMYLDMCKKLSINDLKIVSKELFSKLSKMLDEKEMWKFMEELISKIS